MGLSALSTQPAGRAAVKAGRKPVHFSLDGRRPFCYFCRVYIQHRAKLTLSSDGGRGTGASYTPCLLMKPALRLRLPDPQAPSVFLPLQMPFPSTAATAFEAATPTERITHYTLLRKVVCQKGLCPLWIPPQQNGAMSLAGSIAPFVVSSPFHGLCVVSCKLT